MRERVADLVPRLRRYASALCGGEADTPDELVRSTLERALRELPALREELDLRIWLFSLMHDIYLARPAAPPSGDAGTPLDFVRAIAALPAEQRAVFLLVTLEEFTYQNVARTLRIPIGTVMSRLSRAREKLRQQLMGQATRLRMVK